MPKKLNTVYCCDVTKLTIETKTVDLIIADPPFNKGKNYGEGYDDNKSKEEYYEFCESWIKWGFKVLKDTGSFWIYINSQHLGRLQVICEQYGIWQNTVIWHYTNPTPDKKRLPKTWGGWLYFTKSNEYTFNSHAVSVPAQVNPNSKVGPSVNRTRLSDVWNDIPKLTGGYLAQKEVILVGSKRICIYQLPERLIDRIVKISSNEGDLILDMFSHSGTSSVIAMRLRRNFIAVEQDKFFAEQINKRLRLEATRNKMRFNLKK